MTTIGTGIESELGERGEPFVLLPPKAIRGTQGAVRKRPAEGGFADHRKLSIANRIR